MSKHELLNNITHKDLKVATGYSVEFGDNINCVLTFPTEYADVQREYPILFRKDNQSGEYQSVALLGFAKGENLFLDEDGWHASYVPGYMARGPFLIGFQNQEVEGELRREPVVHVDMESPRISAEGEPIFLPHGGNTLYLDKVTNILKGIHQGMAVSQAMFTAFKAKNLLEPLSIEVEVNDNEQYHLEGYYTISEERLSKLDGNALVELNRSGYLQAAFLVLASLHNVKKLIDIKNRRRAAAHTK